MYGTFVIQVQTEKLGNKDYRNIIPGVNDLGLDWNDEAALDDIILAGSDKIVFAKDSTVHVRITAKMFYNFYLHILD